MSHIFEETFDDFSFSNVRICCFSLSFMKISGSFNLNMSPQALGNRDRPFPLFSTITIGQISQKILFRLNDEYHSCWLVATMKHIV